VHERSSGPTRNAVCPGYGVFHASDGEAALRTRTGDRNQLFRLRSRGAHVHGFTLRKGEAVRVTPDGQVQIVRLQRGAPRNAELKHGAQVAAGILPYGSGMPASRGF
jgi:hypothetical protein